MGWSFRKSVKFGPVRVNLSKSGVGYSVGGKGFRTGVRSNGRRYTTVSIPGTGISHRTEHGGIQSRPPAQAGCAPVLLIAAISLAGAIIST